MTSQELIAGMPERERRVILLAAKGDKEGGKREVDEMMKDFGETLASEGQWHGCREIGDKIHGLLFQFIPRPKPGDKMQTIDDLDLPPDVKEQLWKKITEMVTGGK